ncbi:hypothetical protein, partial [Bradyrhizobium sp. NBAIM08]|uniref:hypothetical protein n=1 Tax=Bradyrhizobium sp. NBAIM08 TaxID=2793815 RepID=UPI001CD6C866
MLKLACRFGAPLVALTMAAMPAAAGSLTDESVGIALSYDDADWSSADSGWPLTCTNEDCVTLVCSIDLDGSETSDAEALGDIVGLQQDLVS